MKKFLFVLLILIMAGIAGYYAFPQKTAGVIIDLGRSRAGLARKEIKINDHNIAYLEGGNGPTVLLLHGYTAQKDNWLLFASYLTPNYHVVIPDIPGYGESSSIITANYNVLNQISRLHQFAQTIKISNFHIVGSSMGGFFAGTYAVRYPEEIISLGLFDALGVNSRQKSEVMKLMEKGKNTLLLNDSSDWSRLMRLTFVNPPWMPYPLQKMFIQKALANRSFYEKTIKEFSTDFVSFENDLPKIKAPALIVWGEQDKIIDISSVPVFEKGLKNHKTVIIKNCGHIPMLEKPQETARQYLDFIKNIKN